MDRQRLTILLLIRIQIGFPLKLISIGAQDAGVDTVSLLKRIGSRLSMLHVSDRGIRPVGKAGSILKADFLELGE